MISHNFPFDFEFWYEGANAPGHVGDDLYLELRVKAIFSRVMASDRHMRDDEIEIIGVQAILENGKVEDWDLENLPVDFATYDDLLTLSWDEWESRGGMDPGPYDDRPDEEF